MRSGGPRFNPRTPCGVRHRLQDFFCHIRSFNPRTPCGVRLICFIMGAVILLFQSTHSLRSATIGWHGRVSVLVVSIHALLAECDRPQYHLCLHRPVSIHALLAECDSMLVRIADGRLGFNPRTPCGVRLRLTIYIVIQQRKRYFAPTSRRRPSSPSLLF